MSARSCSDTILGSQASHLLLQLAHNYSLCLVGHLQYNHFQYHRMAANKGCTVVLHQSIFAVCWCLSSWIVRPSSQDNTMPSSVAQSSVAAAALWRWEVSPMFWKAQRLLSSWSWAFQQAGARASCHKAVGWLEKGAWQKQHGGIELTTLQGSFNKFNITLFPHWLSLPSSARVGCPFFGWQDMLNSRLAG